MSLRFFQVFVFALLMSGLCAPSGAQTAASDTGTVYVVATAHLDTQWRWTIRETIDEHIPVTLDDNFALIEKYPDYVFSFEGAFHYQLMKEYYPERWKQLKKHIETGRWRLAGSWVNAVDVNIPSPESLIRQTLYGNGFYRREFGKTSRDIFLPDCFGFGFALPSIARHCGLEAFSTQKLGWGCFIGTPFDIGIWEGVDGSSILASVNPGAYVSRIEGDLSCDSTLVATVAALDSVAGLPVAFKYFGTGDTGGGPTDDSVAWLQKSIAGEGPLSIRNVAPDQLARDLSEEQESRLPRYRGELLMKSHGVGCYTSQTAMKRWNRQNEILADAAERAAVLAQWLGAAPYPGDRLEEAWTRFLWHQFHDDLTGTSIPEAYEFSWDDELISLNQFASVLASSVGGISRGLETRVTGVPLVVYNPLSIRRRDLVEAEVVFPDTAPENIVVYGPDGMAVPVQVEARDAEKLMIAFWAEVPATGFSVYDVTPTRSGTSSAVGIERGLDFDLDGSDSTVKLRDGVLTSIFDHRWRELLRGPLHLQMLDNEPENWAAWELDLDDLSADPRAIIDWRGAEATVTRGAARTLIEQTTSCDGSTFTRRISLPVVGGPIEFDLEIDWRTPATLLKAAFPLAIAPERATYDLGLGVITRGTNRPMLYEVPAQRWVDQSSAEAAYGVSIMSDSRYGWDRPDAHTMRLTLVHTPAVNDRWTWIDDQKSQDLGRHRVGFALNVHEKDWKTDSAWRADRYNQRLLAFQTEEHAGRLGSEFSFLELDHPGRPVPAVAVRALKVAEQGDEIIVRVQEMEGRKARDVTLSFPVPIVSVREVNGAEEPLDEPSGRMENLDGVLCVDLQPWRPRAFALKLAKSPVSLDAPDSKPVKLPWNCDGISSDDNRSDGDFDGLGNSLASEILPQKIVLDGITYRTGPRREGQVNVMTAAGQQIDLPGGDYDRVCVLLAAVGGAHRAEFKLGDKVESRWIQDYAEPVGQWDNRLSAGVLYEDPATITPAFINRADVAWAGTHRHCAEGRNESHTLTHIFACDFILPPGVDSFTFPDDPALRVLALSVAGGANDGARPTVPLYDRCMTTSVEIEAPWRTFLDSATAVLRCPNPDPEIHYTLDGSDPDRSSPLYSEPITLTNSAVLRARAWSGDLRPDFIASAEFNRATARRPVAVTTAGPGLECRYYTGAWDALPDFDALEAQQTSVMPAVAIPADAAENDIGLTFDGVLEIPRRGVYRIYLYSDDGSAMWMGDEKVIDNDGLHGRGEFHVELPLDPGSHPIHVEFFQRGGDATVELWWQGPGIELQQIPAEYYRH